MMWQALLCGEQLTGDGRVLNRHKTTSLQPSNLVCNATVAFASAFPSSPTGLSGPVLHHYVRGRFISAVDPLQLTCAKLMSAHAAT